MTATSPFSLLALCCCLLLSGDTRAEIDPNSVVQSESMIDSIDGKQIDTAFDEVLADQEFRRLQRMSGQSSTPGWLQRFIDWLLFDSEQDQQRDTKPSLWLRMLGTFIYYLAWALAITALTFVGWVLLRAILRHLEDDVKFRNQGQLSAEQALELSHPPGELPSDEYQRRALALANTGNYKSAVRELVLGSMSWIERAGLIRYRKGLTNRDYIRAIWRKQSERSSLEFIVRVFERAYFGRRSPDRSRFELCLEHYQRAFTGEEILVET
jgi:hypothetical protein